VSTRGQFQKVRGQFQEETSSEEQNIDSENVCEESEISQSENDGEKVTPTEIKFTNSPFQQLV
jgi:hypothetical protein